MVWLAEGLNIWKYVKPAFKPYAPAFKGLTVQNARLTDPQKIAEKLADYYETHFSKPQHDVANPMHQRSIDIFENLSYMPAIPLEQITYEELVREWRKLLPKKSIDSAGTSAFMLKKLPCEYLNLLTILFNKCADSGEFFAAGKIAKIICLSKDGMYPAENKLRPISLLPNVAKLFERVIHRRILSWCHDHNIAVDEQSGEYETYRRSM
ncbi:unnamed protein product [Adineta ricciae]|uniref:Uncharacterized protein n=1 Tax=Adineta ricciae TaxID=249248 RepID=A0A816HFI8_ADIRI|nr:unnamed protein product [Adineta ricciae]